MALFKTSREKRFWLYAFIVVVAIYSTLIFGKPLENILRHQGVQAGFFFFVMALIGLTVIIHGMSPKHNKTEIVIWIGIAAVSIMLFLRLGIAERSHMMEYSILAIFIHKALLERGTYFKSILIPALVAFLITFLIGLFDEGTQLFLPSRIFDPIDILFNSLAAFFAIGSSMLLYFVKKKFRKKT
jgi:hypothetical protein